MDDSVFARDCLRSLLEEIPGVEVVASAVSMDDARERFHKVPIDVIIVSPHQLDPSGSATVRAVNREVPAAKVILLRHCSSDARCFECISTGADACVDKTFAFQGICGLLGDWFNVEASEKGLTLYTCGGGNA